MKTFVKIVIFLLGTMPFMAQQRVPVQLKPLTKNLLLPEIYRISPVALKAMQEGKQPAAFKGVRYKFKPNVEILSESKAELIRRNIKGAGIIQPKNLRQISLRSDKIYLVPKAKVSFKPLEFSRDTLILVRPEFNEVVSEFYLPPQSVKLNLANTTYTLPGTEVSDETTAEGDYLLKMEFKDTIYHIKKEYKQDNVTASVDIKVNLNGHLYIKNPVVTADYSGYDGYSFRVLIEEDADIQFKTEGKFESEVSFPLWAFDVPAGEYGSCRVGIYGFIDMGGKLKLSYTVTQHLRINAGMHGKTFSYIPRTY